MNIYLQLYLAFLKIGCFGFGGGYAMLPLIKSEIVDAYGWITVPVFSDIVAISQMTPGPIIINAATFVGYYATHSIFGSFIATLGVSTPPLVLMVLLSKFYIKFKDSKYRENMFFYLKPATIGLIGYAAISLMDKNNFCDKFSFIIFAVAFVAAYKKIDPIKLMIAAGITGLILYL